MARPPLTGQAGVGAGRSWLGLFGTAVAERQESGPETLKEVGVDEQLGGQIPLDLRFRDENGVELPKGEGISDISRAIGGMPLRIEYRRVTPADRIDQVADGRIDPSAARRPAPRSAARGSRSRPSSSWRGRAFS